MLRRSLILALITASLFAAIRPARAGGWSVVTLDELPACVVAETPLTIGFVVRQHGVNPLEELAPEIVAYQGRYENIFKVVAVEDTPAHYTAELVFPVAGEWQWKFRAFGPEQFMPPLKVLPAGEECPADDEIAADDAAAALAAWGSALFDAKGCSVCHLHHDAAYKPISGGLIVPELTDYREEPDLLCRWLDNPAALKPFASMPDLDLDASEIEALILFLNDGSSPEDAPLSDWCADLLSAGEDES